MMKNVVTTLRRFMMRHSQREQWLLLLCGLLVILTLLWQLLWQPVMAARAASEMRLAYAAQSLDEVNNLAAELEYLRQSNVELSGLADSSQSLPQMLDTLSAQMGISAASLEPASDNLSVGLRFDAVVMSDLLTWLAELESRSGVQVEQITMAPVNNSNTTSGQTVNATLRVGSIR